MKPSKFSCYQVWWLTPIISALRKQRLEDNEFAAGMGYTARPCLKKPRAGNVAQYSAPVTLEFIV
jgi:hypothetical protein